MKKLIKKYRGDASLHYGSDGGLDLKIKKKKIICRCLMCGSSQWLEYDMEDCENCGTPINKNEDKVS